MTRTGTNTIVALEAEDASISTATISVRVLHVGKRQMTQAVFRQLAAAPLVDEVNVKLLGIPWGWVNYHWGDIPTQSTQFIFQVGTNLFRDAFRVRDSSRFDDDASNDKYDRAPCAPRHFREFQRCFRELARAHHLATILEGWRPDRVRTYYGAELPDWTDAYSSNELCVAVTIDPEPEINPHYLTNLMRDGPDLRWTYNEERIREMEAEFPRTRAEAIQALRAAVAKRAGSVVSSSVIEGRIAALEARAVDYCRRWDDLMEQLRGVEQLFIAC